MTYIFHSYLYNFYLALETTVGKSPSTADDRDIQLLAPDSSLVPWRRSLEDGGSLEMIGHDESVNIESDEPRQAPTYSHTLRRSVGFSHISVDISGGVCA